jgi:chemotaxis family two-component system sensor kinase Cph1
MSENFSKLYSDKMAYSVEDISVCELEPIASCGAIQSIGYFISVNASTSEVESVSENFCELLGFNADEIIGKKLDELMQDKADLGIDIQGLEELRHDRVPQLFTRNSQGNSLSFYYAYYKAEHSIGIDLEAIVPSSVSSTQKTLHQFISRLESSHDLLKDCQLACKAIREITGLDRVMVYRFQENWDGEVFAEARDNEYEPFLHLRYPAYDIPAQARDLFLRTNYRMIIDSHEMPVPVLVGSGRSRAEVSLGLSILRASSPIHIQYLKNMGVRSSFSIPIKVHNKLWGLISCHHYKGPAHLPFELRSSCELIARILSGRVSSSIERRRLISKQNSLEFTQAFVNNLTLGLPSMQSFVATQDRLLALIEASGVYIRIEGEELRLGSCPDSDLIDTLIAKAKSSTALGIWKTECLCRDLGLSETPSDAAGALVLPFSFGFEDVVIWFRKEAVREVHWGGKPEKATTPKGRLIPRASFAEWVENLHDTCFPWTEENEESAQFLLFHFIKGIFTKAASLSQANRELERVTRAKDEFIGMVSHELRTPLSAIIGWLDILKESIPDSSPDIEEAIEVIDRNAKLQVNLINDLLDISRIISGKLRLGLKPNIKVSDVLREVVESLIPTAQSRQIHLELSCPEDLTVTADPDRVRQVVWNLVTNAIKFTPKKGVVSVHSEVDGDSYLIRVKDNGKGLEEKYLKSIFDRFSQIDGGVASRGGLGLGLSIVKSLVELHGGEISAESEGLGKGALFTTSMPIFALTADEILAVPTKSPIGKTPQVLVGCRVLLAEDQVDTATALKYLLQRMGAECVLCPDGRSALNELLRTRYDLIISDVGMPDMDGHEFMKAWRIAEKSMYSKPTPAIALTAYATSKDRTLAFESGFQSHIPKPIDKAELVAVIESLGIKSSHG